ncbi:DUF3754 domain-containing protein [Nocardia sp. 2]|uniref:DUF3754 domain-containing protein n=1 Tax=Nocardia acididurans TaxID=2802282 RepID=A0ABS1M0P2_9NOCA|nr:TMEM143 family protein [Nocardia acididurans]MBL1074099.1 DUF3754 domain-containing protein [Nocardia acididurans]
MDAETYVPFRKSAVVSLCAEELAGGERESFLEFAKLLDALTHYGFHVRGEALLDAYQMVDPAEDVRTVRAVTAVQRAAARQAVERELIALAEAAEFTLIESSEIQRAFDEHSLVKVRLEVDDDQIETALFFRRGVSQRTERVKSLFGLRKRDIEFTSYAKVLVYIAFADSAEGGAERPRRGVLLKLFQNVPADDLEMLYPNVRVGMRSVDKLLIGVPAVVSGIIVVVTKLLAALGPLVLLLAFWLGVRDESVSLNQASLLTLGAGVVAFAGYVIRQFSKFKNRKIKLMKNLAEHLYFRNLDNGPGVFHHLLDAAEESEVKETLLAYHFLCTAETPLTAAALDERVETWFRRRWQMPLDYDLPDALRKLRSLGLLTEDEHGALHVLPLPEAKQRLDTQWDNVFRVPAAGAAVSP